jgi:hypothetical protein
MTGFNKNIYLFYPTGYCGSYLNWGLKKSHRDLARVTIDDPILNTGSSHGLFRVPTHQGFDYQLAWLVHAKPDYNTVIPIAFQEHVHRERRTSAIERFSLVSKILLCMDPYPFVINLTDGGKWDMIEIAALNEIDKWPVSWQIVHNLYNPNSYNPHEEPDPLKARGWLIDNYKTYMCRPQRIKKKEWLMAIKTLQRRMAYRKAADVTGEMLDEHYPVPTTLTKTLYEIGLDRILREDFVEWFEAEIDHSVLGPMDFSYWDNFHRTRWLATQKTRHWPEIKTDMVERGVLHPYIATNRLADAIVFAEAIERYGEAVDRTWSLDQLANFIRSS